MDKTPRTKEQIDQEYAGHAVQVGHKTNMLQEHEAAITHLRGDIESHLGQMRKLRKEAAKAPSAQVPPAAEAPEVTSPPVDQL